MTAFSKHRREHSHPIPTLNRVPQRMPKVPPKKRKLPSSSTSSSSTTGTTITKRKLDPRNTTGFRGVYKRKKTKSPNAENQFQAMIWLQGGKNTGLGLFGTAKAAAIAYDRAVLQHGKQKNLLNFPYMVHDLDSEVKGRKKRQLGKCGYRGVAQKGIARFQAQIRHGGKKQSLGTFATAREAAEAYDHAVLKFLKPR